MDLYQPFAGVLLLPDRGVFARTSPVTFGTGEPVAAIRWPAWSTRARFDILDATGLCLAYGGRERGSSRRYLVCEPAGRALLALKLSFWGVGGQATVTLPGGRQLSTKGNWCNRRFSVVDEAGRPVARIVANAKVFALRQDSFAFELMAPVLSIVQAIGLAQCLRAAVESERDVAGGLPMAGGLSTG